MVTRNNSPKAITTDYMHKGIPRRIFWKYVAGPRYLHKIQMSDLVFDEEDYKIRKISRIP